MKPRPRLLFLSPIMPQLTGNGLAMRAGALLEALARTHEVYLLVIPVSGRPGDRLPHRLKRNCRGVQSIPLKPTLVSRLCHHPATSGYLAWLHPWPTEWKHVNTASVAVARQAFGDIEFDHIHVFRLYLHPFAEPRIGSFKGQAHLDLDDIESTTRAAMASHAAGAGVAAQLKRDAQRYRALEAEILPAYDRVYVCSDGDRQQLKARHTVERVSVVPNTVRVPGALPARASRRPFTFLFLGNLDYLPNRDALDWLADEVLPALRRVADEPFKITVAGSGQKEKAAWSSVPEFDVIGYVPNVEDVYSSSDAFIAPLRVGGGTRIKLLESFARGLPVVSTTAGAAGLEVTAREHLLLGDTPADFAESCREIMRDQALRESLSQNAYRKVRSAYSQETLESLLGALTSAD